MFQACTSGGVVPLSRIAIGGDVPQHRFRIGATNGLNRSGPGADGSRVMDRAELTEAWGPTSGSPLSARFRLRPSSTTRTLGFCRGEPMPAPLGTADERSDQTNEHRPVRETQLNTTHGF